MTIIFFRGATAYEMQIWRVWARWTHLSGAYWNRKPWRRFSYGIDATTAEAPACGNNVDNPS